MIREIFVKRGWFGRLAFSCLSLSLVFNCSKSSDVKMAEQLELHLQEQRIIDYARANPDEAEAQYRAGKIYQDHAEYVRAIVYFENAAVIDSLYAQTYYDWGYCLAALGQKQNALTRLNTAKRLAFSSTLQEQADSLIAKIESGRF